jgi:serine/threonine protein kinase
MIQIGEALNHFHQQNWIHRDICPRNVMISDEKTAKMIDFGLVVPNTPPFCKPGNRTGTACYMAPELIKRQTTDQRLDIFSYAVTCFEMYTKRYPWDAALTIDAVLQHINKPPIALSTLIPTIDKQVEAAIMKGLAASPDDRWQTVSEMVGEIREAEARMVRVAREAAAAKAKAPGVPQRSAEPPKPKDKVVMPAASPSVPSSADKKSGKPATPGAAGKPAPKKKRSSDDDVDLAEMFGD